MTRGLSPRFRLRAVLLHPHFIQVFSDLPQLSLQVGDFGVEALQGQHDRLVFLIDGEESRCQPPGHKKKD